MNYELKVTETNKKSAKFHYQVIDENGNIISERKSNREYVACTIDSSFYFGRIDLIGKGDHGICIKIFNATLELNKYPYEDLNGASSAEQALENAKNNAKKELFEIKNIAYKK